MAIYRWIATSGAFDFGVDWANTTLKINPARIPPGLGDVAQFATGGGTVSGTGSVDELDVLGGNSVAWTFAAQLLSSSGSVNGAAVLAAGGAWQAGSLSIGVGGGLRVADGGTLQADGLALQSGSLAVDAAGIAVIGTGQGTAGVLTVNAAISGSGTIAAANGIQNDGIIAASGGFLLVDAPMSGAGTLQIGGGATLSLAQISTVTVTFTDPGGTLLVTSTGTGADAALTAQGVIIGFLPGQTIRYTGPEPVTAALVSQGNPGLSTLTLFSGDTALGALTLAGDIGGAQFDIGGQDALGTALTMAASAATACYAQGTLIRTTRGDVPVEALRPGDRALSAFGGEAGVVWIGHRTVDCAAHPRPHDVWPVRVRRDAFGPGQPLRDLLLSPDHAVFTRDVLVPVRYLLNGATIVQERADTVTYYHVELPAHDVILAESLPCESYLDTGNRAAFANAPDAVMLHPDFARGVWEAQSCAELVLEGPRLHAIRAGLLRRASRLGFVLTSTRRLSLAVDGRPVRHVVAGTSWTVALPPGARELRLRSPVGTPGHYDPSSGDMRELGVAVRGLVLDGSEVAADDPRLNAGWMPPESGDPAADWRWTGGDAVLDVQGCREVRFDVAMAAQSWRPADPRLRHLA